tara:strand:+ start:754 stop:1062 length:309 start_codon:yes stop_codon:yes gene_type:complete
MNSLFDYINTSKEAYKSILPHLSDMKGRVLQAIRNHPSTDDHLEIVLDMRHQSLSACRRQLVKDGLVEESGDYLPTRSGRKANVWVITEAGIVALSKWKDAK